MSEVIGICENCGAEMTSGSGFEHNGRFYHWNDHICLLAMKESHRLLEIEHALQGEQLARSERMVNELRRDAPPGRLHSEAVAEIRKIAEKHEKLLGG